MATITTHYGIINPVPFEDLDVACDNKVFIDPHAIRLSKTPVPFVTDAVAALDNFFDTVSRDAMSSSPADHRHGLDLLQHFEEPWETRMGMSLSGFSGRGGSIDVGSWIWGALQNDISALLRVGVLKHLEELPLFVNGIGRDITSDITTRIVFAPLADFTASMVSAYPEFTTRGHSTRSVERQVWDSMGMKWEMKYVELPIVHGKPLLLVPKGWAGKRLLMSADRYYETQVLSFAQSEQASIVNGKILKVKKDLLRKQPALARGRNTNTVVTLRAEGAGRDILSEFRRFVDERTTRAA